MTFIVNGLTNLPAALVYLTVALLEGDVRVPHGPASR